MRGDEPGPVWTRLPESLTVGDADYAVRTDFRDVLYLLDILADPDYEPDEKGAICLRVMYVRWEDIPPELYKQALDQAVWFIDGGTPRQTSARNRPRVMDWAQDGPLLLPAVNRVLGREVRAMERLHWWSFLGAYMEIGESLFSTVVSLRQKRAKGAKLDRQEMEFYRENRALVDLKRRADPRDEARRQALRALFV